MNETWKNPTEATYMEDTIYVEKDRKKGKKERRKTWKHPYMRTEKKRKEKRNIRSSLHPNKQCQEACRRLQSSRFQQSHFIIIFGKKRQEYKKISVQPSIEKRKLDPQKFLCTAKSRRIAVKICSKSRRSMSASSSASVTITHLELYPKFEELLRRICDHCAVEVEKHSLPAKIGYSNAVRCLLTGPSPPKTAMAASMLSQATSPIIIKLTDDRQKCLFDELFNEGLIQTWGKQLKLSCEKKDKYGSVIEIYGPQVEQGQLMRYIADYSDFVL